MERAGLFVRIPTTQAAQLDRAALKAGMRKQDFVSSLIAAQLASVRPPRLSSTPAKVADGEPAGLDDTVLTLDEAAAMLRVTTDDLTARARVGDLPGRKLGDEWRFSHDALFEWLHGSDTPGRAPGFRKASS